MSEANPPVWLSLRDRCMRVGWLVLDVDGVLTRGEIIYGALGAEANLEVKAFHVRDGSALKLWRLAGKRSAVITGRSSPVVAVRAAELGVDRVVQGAADKGAALAALRRDEGLAGAAVCYVGDDLPDVAALRQAGLAVAVADACPEVRAVAHHVTRAAGGAGAAREVVERVLRCQGLWHG